jgi:WD40 repeat protein
VIETGQLFRGRIKNNQAEWLDHGNQIDPTIAVSFADIDLTRIAIASSLGVIHVIDFSRKNSSFPLFGHVGTVNCISADDRTIISGGSDTIIRCWWLEDPLREPHRIPSFGGEISCTCVSKEFNVHVSGSRDGAIFIIATRTGSLTRVISLQNNGIAKKMLITKEWGFIVAFVTEMVDAKMSNLLFVWSINGEFIRQRRIEAGIAAWMTWSSRNGGDFVVLADETNRIYKGEVFFLDIALVSNTECKVEAVFWSEAERALATVEVNGKVRIIHGFN